MKKGASAMKRTLVALCLAAFFAAPSFAAEMSTAPTDPAALQKLAEEGDSNAQLNLGNYYATPHNAAPDHEQAAIWYRKAAEQGNAEAQYRLGSLYYRGKGGLRQSYEDAYFWFILAAKAGSRPFAVDRDETARHLTDEQTEAVQKRVDDWKPVIRN
ncbi:MAG: sel1 repeat family protein [Alphaproteobacteria bacterium]|nr:MAG: sel1 repeat family protein [Alphaproteobacteria bacterium]